MKKAFLLLLITVTLFSCGKDKKKNEVANIKNTDKFSLVMDAIFEKDDSIVVFYQKNKYFLYEKPTIVKVKGSPMMQRILFQFPEGEKVENIKIEISSNKLQQCLTLKNLSIENNNKNIIDGDAGKYSSFFLCDQSFTWDLKKSRYNLIHTNQYPPGFIGNDMLISALENN